MAVTLRIAGLALDMGRRVQLLEGQLHRARLNAAVYNIDADPDVLRGPQLHIAFELAALQFLIDAGSRAGAGADVSKRFARLQLLVNHRQALGCYCGSAACLMQDCSGPHGCEPYEPMLGWLAEALTNYYECELLPEILVIGARRFSAPFESVARAVNLSMFADEDMEPLKRCLPAVERLLDGTPLASRGTSPRHDPPSAPSSPHVNNASPPKVPAVRVAPTLNAPPAHQGATAKRLGRKSLAELARSNPAVRRQLAVYEKLAAEQGGPAAIVSRMAEDKDFAAMVKEAGLTLNVKLVKAARQRVSPAGEAGTK